jgi:hypothetical protein
LGKATDQAEHEIGMGTATGGRRAWRERRAKKVATRRERAREIRERGKQNKANGIQSKSPSSGDCVKEQPLLSFVVVIVEHPKDR